jgi:hypothetical protein
MHSVADLVEPNIIEELAQPTSFHLGTRIYDAEEVTFDSYSSDKVVALVGDKPGHNSEPRKQHTTQLITDGIKLIWKCTCTDDITTFCKHLVATALATWDKVPADTA